MATSSSKGNKDVVVLLCTANDASSVIAADPGDPPMDPKFQLLLMAMRSIVLTIYKAHEQSLEIRR